MNNPFFKNKGPFEIDKLLKLANVSNVNNFKKSNINDIKDLSVSTKHDISFFHSKKYELIARKTKASFCITTENLKDYLPKNCNKIIVTNVLISTAKITEIFYPDSINDDFDTTVKEISKTTFKNKVNCVTFDGDSISQSYYDIYCLANSEKILLSQVFSVFSISPIFTSMIY